MKMKINKKDVIHKYKQNRDKGITLIALVVTIIVLLILAGISIAMLTGEGGILKNAKEASDKTGRANAIEMAQLDVLETQSNNEGKISDEQFKEILDRYFTYTLTGDSLPEDLSTLILTTKAGKYNDIKASEIYNGKFSGSTPTGPQGPTGKQPGDIVAIPDGKDWAEDKVEPTVVDDKGTVIPVPEGFDYVGGTEIEGVVISDVEGDTMENSKGNQFVWIPVNSDLTVKGTGKAMAEVSSRNRL